MVRTDRIVLGFVVATVAVLFAAAFVVQYSENQKSRQKGNSAEPEPTQVLPARNSGRILRVPPAPRRLKVCEAARTHQTLLREPWHMTAAQHVILDVNTESFPCECCEPPEPVTCESVSGASLEDLKGMPSQVTLSVTSPCFSKEIVVTLDISSVDTSFGFTVFRYDYFVDHIPAEDVSCDSHPLAAKLFEVRSWVELSCGPDGRWYGSGLCALEPVSDLVDPINGGRGSHFYVQFSGVITNVGEGLPIPVEHTWPSAAFHWVDVSAGIPDVCGWPCENEEPDGWSADLTE